MPCQNKIESAERSTRKTQNTQNDLLSAIQPLTTNFQFALATLVLDGFSAINPVDAVPPNQIATECLFRVSSTTILWFFLLLRALIWIKTYPKARILQPFDASKTHNHSSPNCGKVTGLILAWNAEKANQVLARARPTIPHSDSPVKSLNASAQVSAMDFLPTSMSSASNRPKATIFL